jgi:hypothetical protein
MHKLAATGTVAQAPWNRSQVHLEKENQLMPPAKKSPARTTSRASTASKTSRTSTASKTGRASTARKTSRATTGARPRPITRKEVEQATARFEKALAEANDALQTLGQNVGRGAQRAYKDLAKALQVVRRDAQKTNRSMIKDLEKLAAAVTPGRTKTPATRKTPARSARAGSAAKKASRPRRSA